MLTPPKRQSRAIMADSLFPKDRKKQETQDITLEPAGGERREHEPGHSDAIHRPPHAINRASVAQDETLLPKGLKRKALHSPPTSLIYYFIIHNVSNDISSVTAMGQGA